MNTEDMIDNTIASLKIISMIKKNGRLSVRKGQLTIESDDNMQTLRRWFYHDSREVSLMHIKNTIFNAIKISKGILENKIETELKTWSLQRLAIEMQNCQAGLLNLKTTYNDDSLMIANIDVISDRLKAHCDEILSVINSKDYEKPTTHKASAHNSK